MTRRWHRARLRDTRAFAEPRGRLQNGFLQPRRRLQLGHMEVRISGKARQVEDQITYLYKYGPVHAFRLIQRLRDF